MFLGQHVYTLDSKGRLTIPACFRKELTERLVITRGLDHCLALYPLDVWQELTHKVNALPITSVQGRALRRLFFADATAVSLDRQGRMLVPERLREYATLILSHEVVVVGLDRYMELWAPAQWEMHNEQQLEMMRENPALWENLKI